jgi:hypothetical protein
MTILLSSNPPPNSYDAIRAISLAAMHDTRPYPAATAPLRFLLLPRPPAAHPTRHHPQPAPAPTDPAAALAAAAAAAAAAADAAGQAPTGPPPPKGSEAATDGIGYIPRRDWDGLSVALSTAANRSGGKAAGGEGPVDVRIFSDEVQLIEGFCEALRQLDPDILVGWDVQKGGLGYLAERGALLGLNVLRAASRTPEVRNCLVGFVA